MNDDELQVPEMSFEEEAVAEQEQATPAEQEQATPSAQEQPQPQPEPQPSSTYGTYYSTARGAYEQAEKQYKSLVEQVKKLREMGAEVPYELEAQVSQYAAELAILRRDMEEAKRKDALSLVPGLVGKYTGGLPPDLARAAAPILQDALSRAITTNPEVVNDPATLEGLASYAIGMAVRKGGVQARQTQAQGHTGVPSASAPPPAQGKAKPTAMPDEVKRFGISESAWAQVSELPGVGTVDIDL
jgi:hypothetical protein